MYILQFDTIADKMRKVEKALFDAYPIGDRLMENVMFEISVEGGKLSVRATEDAAAYIESFEGSVAKWEKRVLDFLREGYDNLQAVELDDNWDAGELHLVTDLSLYIEDGFILTE